MSDTAASTVVSALPDDAAIRTKMEILVKKVDLETITTKQFIKLLSAEMGGVDLAPKKAYIKSTLTEVLDAMESDEETEDESDQEQKKTAKKKVTGLTVLKDISPEMAAFLGTGTRLARTEVVKGLWAYIKANNLQNPSDKREILLDEKMKKLFNCEKITMFTLNKYVSSHITPFTPVNLEELSENSKKRKVEAARKRKAKKDKKEKNKKAKTKRKEGSHPPYRLSDELKAVVGTDILPRPQVTQALWVYIKENNLQSEKDRRIIVCDDMLKPIMGGNDTVTIFTMNKHITPHMVEKLDKAAYKHEEPKEQDDPDATEDEADSDEESE